jgi:hypothetical protein
LTDWSTDYRASLEQHFQADRYGLLSRLFVHQRDQGGTLCGSSGIQGSGKTVWLLGAAAVLAARGETPIWRGRDLDAWPAFPGPVRIWADHPIQVFRIPFSDEDADLEPWPLPVHRFHDPDELVMQAEKGVLNVVYATEWRAAVTEEDERIARDGRVKTRFWDRMVRALAHKPTTRWHATFIDEIHEVWGDRPQAEDWHAQRSVRDGLADFRKSFNSLFTATHHYDECDDAILKKFQFHAYLRGARIPNWSIIRNKELAHKLHPGQVLLESGHFGIVTYPNIPKPPFQVKVIDALVDEPDLWATSGAGTAPA